jgi:AraC-like DNA-binding protein
VNISLSARAAIRGGLPYELAYCLADAYCQQIDSMGQKDLVRLENVIRNIQITFTELVSQQKVTPSGQNSAPIQVGRAKDYIFSHLHGKLTVGNVAEALDTHPNYLTRIFKESEGLTVHDYILREKTKLAQNMLAYSDYTFSEIASTLGFASQSHMGNTFKKYTGSTPREYRDTYRKSRDKRTR